MVCREQSVHSQCTPALWARHTSSTRHPGQLTGDAAQELRRHVGQAALPVHVPGDDGAQGDRGVEVAARHVGGGICMAREGGEYRG